MDATPDDLCVIYDACVLYPAPLRDVLVSLAVTRLFRARWTADIHDEWIRNLLDDRSDLIREQLERTRDFMDRAVPDSLVTGYQGLIGSLPLPDRDDEHVLAAAIHSRARLIITLNVKHFPSRILSNYGVETRRPDDFIVQLLEDHPVEVVTALGKQRRRLSRPPQSVEQLLDTLLRQGLGRTVKLLRQHADAL